MPDFYIIPCIEDDRPFVKAYNRHGHHLFSAKDAVSARSIIIRDHASLAAATWAGPDKAPQPKIHIGPRIPQPFDASLEEFICQDAELDVDPIFGKPLSRLLADYDITDRTDRRTSHHDPRLKIETVRAGVILSSQTGMTIGAYLGCDLSLVPEWQGRGLGTELVIERCLLSGINPAAQLDNAAYTPAGHAAHISAWKCVRSNPLDAHLRLFRQSGEMQHLEAA